MCLKYYCFLFVALLFFSSACKKIVDVETPVTSTAADIVYSSDATAAAVLTGIYLKMSANRDGLLTLCWTPGLSADELDLFDGANNPRQDLVIYYTNTLQDETVGQDYNYNFYQIIYRLNAAIEGLNLSTKLTPLVKSQLLGEAYFMRAFCYFYLANLYGGVPLALTTDYKSNSLLSKSSAETIYQQLISDLKKAKDLLSDEYRAGNITGITTERVRPNKAAATALLARIYLYNKNYREAADEASLLLSQPTVYDTVPLNDVFLRESKEVIWSVQPVAFTFDNTVNTQEAKFFILPASGEFAYVNYPVYLSDRVVDNFEPGDQRKTNWTGSVMVNGKNVYYPFKYKVAAEGTSTTEYSVVLRLAEQYLIRAEALARLGDFENATKDINVIRKRAGLLPTTAGNEQELINAILHERRVEFFAEWGHRWLDIKRLDVVDSIMSIAAPLKGGTWTSDYKLYPFSTYDLTYAPNLEQNSGY